MIAWLGVQARSGENDDGVIMIGFDYDNSHEDYDRADIPKPRFYEQSLELGLKVGWDPGQMYLTDYRGELGEGQSWNLGVKSRKNSRKMLS